MSTLFGSSSKGGKQAPDGALRIQTSLEGKPIAIGWGQARLSANLIWYDDFKAVPKAASGGGGKGGLFGAPKQSSGFSYYASCVLALCFGPVTSILKVWKAKEEYDTSGGSLPASSQSSATFFLGSTSQAAWGYLSSLHPTKALPYRNIAYVGLGPLFLGDSSSMPNLGFEVRFALHSAISGKPDANPADVLSDLLISTTYGVGFGSGNVASLTIPTAYWKATGLVISPVLGDQKSAQEIISDWLEGTNAEAVWSQGEIKFVPYGDQTITANGATYAAPSAPVYALTDDDFIAETGARPIKIRRSSTASQPNSIKVEYLDRANSYNPAVKSIQDDAAVTRSGLISAESKAWHFFCDADAAQMAATLALGRELKRNEYEFTLGAKFILLEPMDIVSLSSTTIPGLAGQWVRIKEIRENADYTRSLICEEYLAGTAAAPLYGSQGRTSYVADYNAAAGNVATPVIFEPTKELAGGLEVWAAVHGVNLGVWGGCDVYASFGDQVYEYVGTITGGARVGALTAALNSVPVKYLGKTLDLVNNVAVNLAASGGQLMTVTQDDVDNASTLCYLNGELLAYRDVNVTGANAYQLSYLARGLYGTSDKITTHAIGAKLVRLDEGIAKIGIDETRIGSVLSLKFVSFNIWGGGQQTLATVSPYTYTIGGLGLDPVNEANEISRINTENDTELLTIANSIISRNDALAIRWQAELEAETRFGADAVIDLKVDAVSARTDAGTASGRIRFEAVSSPGVGVSAAYDIQVKAELVGGTFTEAGLRLEVMSGGGSRIVMTADSLYVRNGSTNMVPFSIVGGELYQASTRFLSEARSDAVDANGDPLWRIDNDGTAEFRNAYISGTLGAVELGLAENLVMQRGAKILNGQWPPWPIGLSFIGVGAGFAFQVGPDQISCGGLLGNYYFKDERTLNEPFAYTSANAAGTSTTQWLMPNGILRETANLSTVPTASSTRKGFIHPLDWNPAFFGITYPHKIYLPSIAYDRDFIVPDGCFFLFVKCWGAGGGTGSSYNTAAGAGGHVAGKIAVTPGDKIRVQVGAGGSSYSCFTLSSSTSFSGVNRGYAGAGAGAFGQATQPSGGGRTGIFKVNADGSLTPLFIAAGGGSTGSAGGGSPGGVDGLYGSYFGTWAGNGGVGESTSAANQGAGGGGWKGGFLSQGGANYIDAAATSTTNSSGSGATPPATGDADYVEFVALTGADWSPGRAYGLNNRSFIIHPNGSASVQNGRFGNGGLAVIELLAV